MHKEDADLKAILAVSEEFVNHRVDKPTKRLVKFWRKEIIDAFRQQVIGLRGTRTTSEELKK